LKRREIKKMEEVLPVSMNLLLYKEKGKKVFGEKASCIIFCVCVLRT
jgi:hypothetical protein